MREPGQDLRLGSSRDTEIRSDTGLSSYISAVIDEMVSVVRSGWRTTIIDHGGSESDCDAVRGALLL